MMNKKEILKMFKNVNLPEAGSVGYVEYWGLTKDAQERMIKEHGEDDAEFMLFMVGGDVEEDEIANWGACSYEFDDFVFEGEMELLFDNVFKNKYKYFIYFSDDGFNPPAPLEEMKKGYFLGNGDFSLYVEDMSRNRKVLKLRYSSHDVLGEARYIVGLTEKQHEEIMKRINEDFESVREILNSFSI